MTDEDQNNAISSNAGWADAIEKILKTKKPKRKKTIVLSKAKKLTEKPKTIVKLAGFEVATADGAVKEETVEVKEEDTELQHPRKKKKQIPSVRSKPNVLNDARERELKKIATKGVVQFFNAVSEHQRNLRKKLEEAGPLESRKEKAVKSIDKKTFLNILMGEKSKAEATSSDKNGNESQTDDTWNVLRDDFMMGNKMKDWDKNIETELE